MTCHRHSFAKQGSADFSSTAPAPWSVLGGKPISSRSITAHPNQNECMRHHVLYFHHFGALQLTIFVFILTHKPYVALILGGDTKSRLTRSGRACIYLRVYGTGSRRAALSAGMRECFEGSCAVDAIGIPVRTPKWSA